jgi:hypothetical protein
MFVMMKRIRPKQLHGIKELSEQTYCGAGERGRLLFQFDFEQRVFSRGNIS